MQRLARKILLGTAAALAGCSGAHDSPRENASAQPKPVAPVLNVPELVRLDIDALTRQLGRALPLPPVFYHSANTTLLQQDRIQDSAVLFKKPGLELVATYNWRRRTVVDLLVLGADEAVLMQRAHLQLDAEAYVVLPVYEHSRPTELFGLRVVPTQLVN